MFTLASCGLPVVFVFYFLKNKYQMLDNRTKREKDKFPILKDSYFSPFHVTLNSTLKTNRLKLLPTFVQFAIDVFGKFLCGFYIGWVNIQSSTVGPAGISQLHRVFTNIQDVSPEVLNLGVLHKVKLTHRHTNGKTCQNRRQTSVSVF